MIYIKSLVLVVLLGLTACQDRTTPQYRMQQSMTIEGWKRTYLLNLPPSYYESDNFPLVIALHGTGGNAIQCERDYGLTRKADENGYVIVYPEGVPRSGPFAIRTWNAGRCCDYAQHQQVDDVKFIRTLLDEIVTKYKIDTDRVYVTGMSNGAMMTYRLACEMADRIAAIAPVSGTLMTSAPCTPSRALPIIHIHSVLDEVIPYYGGVGLAGYTFSSVDSAMNVWATLNTCDVPEETAHDKFTFTKWSCHNGVTIERYVTEDGGHAWPGGMIARPGADKPSTAIDATELIWEFFERVK